MGIFLEYQDFILSVGETVNGFRQSSGLDSHLMKTTLVTVRRMDSRVKRSRVLVVVQVNCARTEIQRKPRNADCYASQGPWEILTGL